MPEPDIKTAVATARLARDIEALDHNIRDLEAAVEALRLTRSRLDAGARTVCHHFNI
jgi:prefoldin subunit 5